LTQRLAGKVTVVTGAGRGIGLAIAQRFAAEGAKVACCDLDESLASSAAMSIRDAGGEAEVIVADIADKASVDRLVAETIARFARVDVVCNNAGILDGYARLGDVTDELWDRVMSVNLKGCFLVSRAFLAPMLAQGKGTFVNIASMAGLIAQAGGLAYTASKHGVIGLTKQVSADYGQEGIRANAICPGAIETDLSRTFLETAPDVLKIVESVPAGRQGQPAEIAELAVYLASDASGFVHGAAMVIDGGWTIR
jgi:3-oxoacyl-[acyl-carrier protein] reductase